MRKLFPSLGAVALVITLGLAGAPAAAHGSGGPPHSAGCGTDAPIAPGESESVTITSGDIERSAVVSVPDGYNTHRPFPAILAFHGRGSTGAETQEFSGISHLPVIGIFPEGIPTGGKQSWQGAPYAADGVDDVLFVRDLLDTIEEDYCIDTHRVYATGKSNGGGFAALLACEANDRIAAFAPVAGAFYPGTEDDCDGESAPMLEFHGTDDTTIEYEGGVSHGVAFPSVTEWLSRWADRNDCERSWTRPITIDAVKTVWRGCDGRDDLAHVAVLGGGHTWPGALAHSGGGYTSPYTSATELMWQFFRTHRL